MSSEGDKCWDEVGHAIRTLRLSHSLTLVELAARADLSQPFLSQVETGRAKPSMSSLYRIATALETTPQALFGGSGVGNEPAVARAHDDSVPAIATDGESLRRLLLPGDAPFHVIELIGLSTEFLNPWQHDGFEALYVLVGPVEIEVNGSCTLLNTGDFLSYPATAPHRYRSAVGDAARILLIESRRATESVAHGAPGTQ